MGSKMSLRAGVLILAMSLVGSSVSTAATFVKDPKVILTKEVSLDKKVTNDSDDDKPDVPHPGVDKNKRSRLNPAQLNRGKK